MAVLMIFHMFAAIALPAYGGMCFSFVPSLFPLLIFSFYLYVPLGIPWP